VAGRAGLVVASERGDHWCGGVHGGDLRVGSEAGGQDLIDAQGWRDGLVWGISSRVANDLGGSGGEAGEASGESERRSVHFCVNRR